MTLSLHDIILKMKQEKKQLEFKFQKKQEQIKELEEQVSGINAAIFYLTKYPLKEQTNEEKINHMNVDYSSMTFVQAIKIFLIQQGKPCSTREIAEGLKQGGIQTQAQDFIKIITTTAGKHKHKFMRNNDGLWILRDDAPSALKEEPISSEDIVIQIEEKE